ncbi:hypothetical protein [Nioella sp.]|uniref:hypothetical protein n=1 Tax=Nioella sp. TaxID=1912091 RepID=UPI003B51ABD8
MSDDKVVPITTSPADIERVLQRLKSGGGDGTSDGMEPRVAKLEAKAEGIEKRLDDIKGDLARIETKLLSKWDVAQVVFYVMGIVMAAVIFGPRISSLLGP